MTVESIQFNDIFMAADSPRVADASGLAPLSFNPPSPESLGRFLASMSGCKSEVDSIRLAMGSIAQNMSSPRDVSKPVVAPVAAGSRPAAIVGKPVVESPDTYCCSTLVVEKPVVEAPAAPVAPDPRPATIAAVPATPTAPVAPDSRPATIAAAQVTPAAPVATPAVESPVAPVATPVVESPVAPAAPVAKSSVVESPAAPAVDAPVAKSELTSARPVVAGKRTAAPEEVVVIDLSQESARAAAPLREAPFVAAAQQEIVASTASARTEAIVEVVNNVAEAIADQILVTPSLVRGEGQMIVRLKPEVLDGSEIRLSSESGTLAVEVVPSTPNAAKLATEAMPRLETALAEHVSAFRKISVSVRKGKGNEIV